MRKVIVDEWVTLDGVAQAPGDPKEDTTGGFAHGGWHMNYVDEDFQQWILHNLNEAAGSSWVGERTRALLPIGQTPLRKSSRSLTH